MFIYWFIWVYISVFTFIYKNDYFHKFVYILTVIFLIIFVGLRFKVGGDWDSYILLYEYFYTNMNINEIIFYTDPAYGLLNFLSHKFNFSDTILVNFICALVIFIALYRLSVHMVNIWLPIFISFSYYILVVSMGYTRQSVAISLVLLAFYFLLKNVKKYFVLCSLMAILFHKSAIIIIAFYPILFFHHIFKKNYIFFFYSLSILLVISAMLYFSALYGDNLYTSRSGEVSSSGALFRIIIHIPALLFYMCNRVRFKNHYFNIYRFFDFAAIVIIFSLFLGFIFSTIADRFNLYLISFDIFVYHYLYLISTLKFRIMLLLFIFILNTLVLSIWLNFGAYTYAWLPYQNYLFNFIKASL